MDGAFGRAVRARMEKTETVLYDRPLAARAAGQIASGTDIRAVARYALVMVQPCWSCTAAPATAALRHRRQPHCGTGDSRIAGVAAKVALEVFPRPPTFQTSGANKKT